MTRPVDLRLQVHQTSRLAEAEGTVHAIVSVSASRAAPAAPVPTAVLLLLDCSTSMRFPQAKIVAARRAAAAAIDVLRDGVLFGVVAGTSQAHLVYPPTQTLVAASDETRAAAKLAIEALRADGGTAIGTWLALARDLLASHDGVAGHALLLTDGHDESEAAAELDRVLASCAGAFVCDARGIGDGWDPAQLRKIAAALRGRADAVLEDSALVADFRAVVGAAMGKVLADVALQIRLMPFCRLQFLKQVFPDEYDLTDRCTKVEPGVLQLTTGSWAGGQDREYHLGIEVAGPLIYGQDRQLALLELVGTAGGAFGPVPIVGHWTHDPLPETRVHPKVRQYALQADLAEAVRAGGIAHAAAESDRVQQQWGRAVRLAHELGNADMLARLGRLVEVLDAAAGQIRLKDNLGQSAILSAMIGSGISARRPPVDGDPVRCPDPGCAGISPPGAQFCVRCGDPL